jgi:hypothetical protein
MGLHKQFSKDDNSSFFVYSDVSLSPVASACNLGMVSLTLNFLSLIIITYHPSTNLVFSPIRDLGRIRLILDQTTARNIVASLNHAKPDYYHSTFLNLPDKQLEHLQRVLNSAARAVTST